MNAALKLAASALLGGAFCTAAIAQDVTPKTSVLITNANIFYGKSDKLSTGMSVLVEDNKIAKIGKSITAPSGATVIDAEGRTLMPGLADAHVHPYPGDLGMVMEGAYADLLLVEGNPLQDLKAVTDSANLKIIMKDGKFYKNTLK